MNIKEVKQWQVYNGRAVAVNHKNTKDNFWTWPDLEIWRRKQCNQPFTNAPDGNYPASDFNELVWQIEHTKGWSDIKPEWYDLYINSNATTRQFLRYKN